MPMHAPLPFEDAMRDLRIKFEALLICEVEVFGGIPNRVGRTGQMITELHEAIAVALKEYGEAIAP